MLYNSFCKSILYFLLYITICQLQILHSCCFKIMQCQLFTEIKFYHPARLISTASCSNATHHACTMSNITLENGYVAFLYFSYWMDVSRRKMWKVRGRMLRTKDSSGRLPGDSFCPWRPSRQLQLRGKNLKEWPAIISFLLLIRLQTAQQRSLRSINRKDNYCE